MQADAWGRRGADGGVREAAGGEGMGWDRTQRPAAQAQAVVIIVMVASCKGHGSFGAAQQRRGRCRALRLHPTVAPSRAPPPAAHHRSPNPSEGQDGKPRHPSHVRRNRPRDSFAAEPLEPSRAVALITPGQRLVRAPGARGRDALATVLAERRSARLRADAAVRNALRLLPTRLRLSCRPALRPWKGWESRLTLVKRPAVSLRTQPPPARSTGQA